MTYFGLNSPVIFIILVVFLAVLGPKRWEKGAALFLKLLKFLLRNEVDQTINSSKSVQTDERFKSNNYKERNKEEVKEAR